ncbi:hypothetical protein HYC85_023514 [Camellia sinensis]|uniref:Squalene cyclase N-terminal domain-containing protein n=1 Tax=Camellia sinensis TaxID=4442 RepID=A0A7J7GG20_CAMSI|nr:hypothetical protein HYC85_023514 [Camellia sinensis]
MIYETSSSLQKEKTEKTEPGSQTEARHERVRKSGGKARSRDSETSERAQYATSPSAQSVICSTDLKDKSAIRPPPSFMLTSFSPLTGVHPPLSILALTAGKDLVANKLTYPKNFDGGWGLHIEGSSTMFCTALNYVTLRLLGERMNDGDGAMEKARKWILDHGGRMWCHCRMVYLPMSYLYGKRFVGPINATILSLRRELYTHPYHQIDWNQARYLCAKEDLYYPHPMIQDILWDSLHKIGEPLLMRWPFYRLRKKALSVVMEHIHYEDENTKYICLGPVNKVLNMICCWVDDPNSMANQLHLSRIKDYLWVAEDGMKMQGYNGSQLWDVAFAVQAILSTNLVDEYGSMLKKSHEFIRISQARMTAQAILASGTVTFQRVGGLSLPQIMVGLYQIALQKV